MQCYNCNNIYNDYLGYCPYCGVKKEDFNVCSDCEEKLTKDILICPVCGGKPIEETNEIIFFPTESSKSANCIWISLNNIKSYEKSNTTYFLLLPCGTSWFRPMAGRFF